jgi:glycosyltransferase involved in cell wall biosynthesis
MLVTHPAKMRSIKEKLGKTINKHSEIVDSDVVVLHNVLAASSDMDVPTVLVLHGGLRELGHFYEHIKNHNNPTADYFAESTLSDMRETATEWLSNVDVIAANSEFCSNSVKEYYNTDSRVIYPPIDTSKFRISESTSNDFFLSVQRMVWYKRPDVQIEAFSKLDEKLVIVGEGPYEDAVAGECEKYDNITYLGRVSDEKLLELYQNATATIQTSINEDFGYVPRESMACGTPVITPTCGGFRELHDKGDVGVEFDNENMINSLRKKVTSFDDTYSSEELRNIVEQNHSFEATKPKFEKAIEDAKQRHR